jgi:FtsH-binding integral membrane protein
MSNEGPRKTVVGWAVAPQSNHPPHTPPWNGPPVYQQPPPVVYGQPPPQPPQPPPPYPPQPQPYHGEVQLPEYLQPGYPQQPPPGYGQQPQPGYGQQQPPGYGEQQPGYLQYQQQPPQYPQHPPPYPQHPPQQAHQPLLPAKPVEPLPLPRAAKGTKAPKAAKTTKDKAVKPPKGERPIKQADATVGVSQRVRFIRLTYFHLLLAILAFAGLLYLLMTNPFLVEKVSIPLVKFALGGRWNWGIVLAAFMVVSWVADYWASHSSSRAMQYAGLGFYIIAEALIFVPLLAIVQWKTAEILARGGGDPNILRDSAFVTLGIFTALTLSVFITKKDFSYLRSGLIMASGAALMLVILSLTFGFNLGLVFSVGMVLLAAAYILYQTSQVLAHYDPNQHVAASLALFSSVALMFWYVIRIFMRARE